MISNINLLPPGFKRIERLDRLAPRVWIWFGVATIALVTILGTALIARQSIDQQSQRLAHQITGKEAAGQFDDLSAQVKSLATLAEDFQRVFAKNRVWEEMFTYLEQTVPADTTIESVSSSPDKQNYTISVTGTSADRRSIGLFRENLLSYRSQPSQPERVSQVIIDSITADETTGRQHFILRLTFDLNPPKTTK